MRFLPLLVALLCVAGCATSPKTVPLTLNWAGLYDVNKVRSAAPSSEMNVGIPNSRLLSRQDRVPAQAGTLFGLNFTIPRGVVGEEVTLRRVIRFPTPGLTNPQGQLLVQNDKTLKVRAGHPFTTGYRLSEDWEIQEGEWIFEIWQDAQLLLSHPFYVTHKQPAPDALPPPIVVENPQCPQLTYPRNAIRNKKTGQTQVLFTVKGDGGVEDVSVLTPSGTSADHAELDAEVSRVFKKCRFNPVPGVELYYIAQAVVWVLR